jgi:dihydrofolate synthase / folylpolyglutamate synthase
MSATMPAPPGRYAQFLERLRAYERYEPLPRSRGPEKLEPVRRLAEALGHPERHERTVHVAGTNGKGMTSAMIARLLQAAGRRTGLYTSPHVLDVRERIAIDGAPIAEAAFAEAGHAVLDVADRLRAGLHFSYFDLLTLIAWRAFRAAGVEWVVLETGLGGRSDATNLGPKALAVLTRIGLDHMHVLGDTLQAIATQKLGIVPPGVPSVLAVQAEELEPWLRERLAAQGSPVRSAAEIALGTEPADAAAVRARWPQGEPVRASVADGGWSLSAPRLACAATALVAGEALLGPAAGPECAARLRTVLETHLPARLERRRAQAVTGLPGGPLALVVLDGGHNGEAVAALDAHLRRWQVPDYTLLLGLQRDKLVEALRAPLASLLGRARRVLTLAPQTVRAPQPEELRAWLQALLPPPARGQSAAPAVEVVADARAALAAALEAPQRPLVATGSFWMLGDVMRLLGPAAAETDAAAPDTPQGAAEAPGAQATRKAQR